MEVNTNTPVNSFYTIVTGLFRFEQKRLDEEGLWKNFINWRNRINEQFQEKREKSFNIALIVITLLSVFSVIYDLSEWTVKMGVEREFIYPVPSITSGIIMFLLIYLIFKVKRK